MKNEIVVVQNNFNKLFSPKSVAIIGPSKNKIGGIKYYFALQSSGYIAAGGKVFLINPKYQELFGIKVYPSLDDPEIPKPIDLVIVSVPAELVPSVVKTLNKNNATFASIFSSGFIESGNQTLDKELKDAVKLSSTRYLGPNCLGVMNPGAMVAIYPDWKMLAGNVSYVAQSGGTMARLYHYLTSISIGFANVMSIGNMIDIQPEELIAYFLQDSKTKCIALYLESIKNGALFAQTARNVARQKPIILWKGGQSERGRLASFSHTGGLAGSAAVWKAMAKQNGIMTANNFEQFMDLVHVASLRPTPPKNLNVAILVAGGGIGVEYTDIFEQAGLKIPDLNLQTQQELAQVFPSVNTNFKNPIDLGEYGYDPRLFAQAMEIVLKDDNIGSVVFVREPERFKIISSLLNIKDPQQDTIDSLTKIISKLQKPIFCTPSANSDSLEAFQARITFQKAMILAKLPVINFVVNLPHIILQLYEYGRFLALQK